MKLALDRKSPVPFYRQIVDRILVGISNRAILPGEKLPTIRELAVELEVNPNTVVKAYSHLQLLGVLDTQQGSGAFVRERDKRVLSKAEKQRILEDLCRDFVGRAEVLGIDIDELMEQLKAMGRKRG